MKKYKNICVAIIVSILFETLIFNFGFFRTLILSKNNIKAEYEIKDDLVIISNIDFRVTNITFNYKNNIEKKVNYLLYYTADESSGEFALKIKTVLNNNKNYINFDTHSSCTGIKINIITR